MISLTAFTWYAVYIMTSSDCLQSLGWRNFFQSQLDTGCDWLPARVLGVHRNRIDIAHAEGRSTMALSGKSAQLGITIGDWVLVDPDGPEGIAAALDEAQRHLQLLGVADPGRGAALDGAWTALGEAVTIRRSDAPDLDVLLDLGRLG